VCGIAGSWGGADVAAMTAALTHRGPDDAGFHLGERVRLGARRLAIVDIAGGAQPVYNETGQICAVVNGEIYNHRELRTRLQAMGHRFSSRCDIEVIVHLYEEYGDRCAEHLRGMFAFAIADGSRLLLGRDRLGIKPLYYTVAGGTVLFASEIKALVQSPLVHPALDMQAFADSRILGYPVGDRTFIEGIRAVLPAHTVTVDADSAGPDCASPDSASPDRASPDRASPDRASPDGPPRVVQRRYWQLPGPADSPPAFDDAQDQLIDLLRDVTRSHLAADVEVGLILSGGLDSTVLALLARDTGTALRSYGVDSGPGHPDRIQSARVSGMLGWQHVATTLSLADYLALVPAHTYAQEEPGRLGGLGLHAAYQRAGADLKVCLSGEGADELFGGYDQYLTRRHLARTAQIQLRGLRGLRGLGLAPSPGAREIVDAVSRDQPMDEYVTALLGVNLRDQLVRMHLEVLDKCAMAASLEVRVPYLDHRLVEFVAGLPAGYKVSLPFGIGKYVLRRAVLRTWGADGPLADTVLRRKIGAPTAGLAHREQLAQLCERDLPAGYLDRHELGACFATKLDLLLFELFTEIFVTGRGADPASVALPDFIAERAGRPVPVPA
jgi:asparagine synthase (glutamine-hydrolysing)